jgi:hypothetical protein
MHIIFDGKSITWRVGDTEGTLVHGHGTVPDRYFFRKGETVYSGAAAYILCREMNRRYIAWCEKANAEALRAKTVERIKRTRSDIAIIRGVNAWLSSLPPPVRKYESRLSMLANLRKKPHVA